MSHPLQNGSARARQRAEPADEIRTACARVLVAGARAKSGVSRQQARAAARHFVRRHRRDTGYLAWVLRSVAANAALAVTLLGLGVQPASADATLFAPQLGIANPLDGEDVGSRATPVLGDLDGDGDLDLVAGEFDGTFLYYENTGSAAGPVFVLQTGAANPLDGEDVGSRAAPVLGDLDRDGDLDLVAGMYGGTFLYYENTGSATSPLFVLQAGAANPLDGQDAGFYSKPALGDLDGDGDLDLVAGEIYGTFLYYENTGSATSPVFVLQTGAANPLDGEDVGYRAHPAFGDLDGDGDLDLVAGEFYGTFHYYENTGSAAGPVFVLQTGAASPLDGEDVGYYSTPAFGDLDGDGDLDLVAGENYGTFLYYENLAGSMVARTGAANPLDGEDVGYRSAPGLGDLDGDGDLDLVAGEIDGTFLYYENTGSAVSPVFVLQTGAANPLDGEDLGDWSTPAFGDLDGDGDLDLVAGELNGKFLYYENTGSATSAVFVLQTGAANPLDGEDVGARSHPAFGDLDGDGDLDLVAGETNGTFLYFENTGSAASPVFVLQTGAANPLDGEDVGLRSYPAFGDLDGDGDLDLAAGENLGTFLYFENTGNATSPVFVPRTGATNPLDGEDVGIGSTPAFGDLDGDGDLDLVAGEYYGTFLYYENAIVEPSLSAIEQTGAANPLDGEDVGSFSAPAFGDLDGDGDLDLLAGEQIGTFLYYENTGSATSPVFVPRTGSANPLDGEDVGSFSAPAFGDLDGDGDLDLVAGELFGTFLYYENTGSAASPAFVLQTGAANPLDGEDVGYYSTPALGDLDGDGDLDLVAGEFYGTFLYYENTGSATSPVFVPRTGAANPLDGEDVGFNAAPALGDVDGDGEVDLVAGESYGTFPYYENTGSATSPVFVPRTGAANPLDGEDVGLNAAPALGNLDGDGDLDLVAGERFGMFRTYYLPEPVRGLMLAAGLALLKALERLRLRRAR